MLEEDLIYTVIGPHTLSSQCNYWHVLHYSISSLNIYIYISEYIYIYFNFSSNSQTLGISKHFKTQLENLD